MLNRWKEQFENLLNRDDPADKERIIAEIRAVGDNINENSSMNTNKTAGSHEGHSERNIEGHKPTKERQVTTINRLCNLTNECLRDTGVTTKVWLHRVIKRTVLLF